jgi:type II secretory pathway pseudopilin PulG
MISVKITQEANMNIQLPSKAGNPPHSQAGYTLLEGLMAVIVVSVMLLAIGPVITFSVGTRFQAKRVELAIQAAKTYIDGVKSGAIPAPVVKDKPEEKVNQQAAPTGGSLTCDDPTNPNLCNNKTLYCVDFDGDKDNDGKPCEATSPVDMVVQGLGYNASSTDATKGYQLGVRVYRANSFVSGVTLKQPTANEPLTPDSLTTNSLGNRSLPLVQMSTEVLPKDATWGDIQNRLKTLPSQ